MLYEVITDSRTAYSRNRVALSLGNLYDHGQELEKEERKFLETLQKGEHEFEKLLPNLLKNPQKVMSGRLAFKLYDTYGFPIELTEELAAENGMTVNREEFDEAFKKHRNNFV